MTVKQFRIAMNHVSFDSLSAVLYIQWIIYFWSLDSAAKTSETAEDLVPIRQHEVMIACGMMQNVVDTSWSVEFEWKRICSHLKELADDGIVRKHNVLPSKSIFESHFRRTAPPKIIQ